MIEYTGKRAIPAKLIYDFLEFPQDLKSELDVDDDKIKHVEIFDEDFPHSASQTTSEIDAAIAGAVIGNIVAGPVGAMVAGATAALVSHRDVSFVKLMKYYTLFCRLFIYYNNFK